MLVRVRPGAELSGAEREFAECLGALPSTGLALLDVPIGESGGARRVGAVLFTPTGLTVLEVFGFRRRQSGILTAVPGKPWLISDSPLDLEQQGSGDLADRVEQSAYAVRAALERGLRDPGHVCGAAVLVPFRGVVVRPARTTLRPGLDVVVGNAADTTELRIYLENFAKGPRTWTADGVLGACRELGAGEAVPPRAELLAAGFDQSPEQQRPSVIPPPVVPRVAPTPREPHRHHRSTTWAIILAALLGLFVVFGVVATALIHDDGDTGEPVAPSATSTPPPASSTRPPACFPLQPDC
ncbi:NERD domain-containing protein [Nocardia sp. NPDC057227]|uniref:NERD domain-containing protein n=1 Tax=Nocardia sp. NPDC057227 TaxID=3346056 RepID=UPI0036454AAB